MPASSTTRKRWCTTPRCARLRARCATSSIPDNPYPRQFTGHVRVTLKTGEVREASQGHFRGGREEPMSAAALEAKFIANCIYGGWDADRARSALAVLRALRTAPRVDLAELRG